MLKSLDYYQELPVSSEILNLIAKMNAENAARVGGIEPNTNNWVGFYNNLSYLFTLGPSYLRYNNTFLMLIPDMMLKFDEIPGLKEISEDVYQKMYEENVNWFKNKEKELG
jgi:hypothetical protein